MSDEHERRRDPQPDETRVHPDEGTRSGDPQAADRTRQMPAQGDETSVMPAGDSAAQDAPWSGRAEVRPPQPAGYGTTMPGWEAVPPPEEEPSGNWWMPILLGILALILLALLGWGIYLITRNSAAGENTPAPTPSVTVPPTTGPTTTPPTTEPTTTKPTTTETSVTVPALVGLSREEAQKALDRRGLTYRLIYRPSDAAAGTVIDSDPAEGQQVPPDTQVTLVIAAEATTPPGTPPTDQADEN